MTDLSAVIVAVQVVPEETSQPLQPLKTERRAGATLRVTTVPEL